MPKVIKKVRECTVEDLIALGKADNVSNLRITIDGSNNENKHFDVNIGGAFYGRKLFLDDEVEVEIKDVVKTTLLDVLKNRATHQYGKIKFLDKNNLLLFEMFVKNTFKISPAFYNYSVEYEELVPTNNAHLNELVAIVRFVDLTDEQIKRM